MTETWIKTNLPLDTMGRVVLAKDVARPGDSIVIEPSSLATLTASLPDVATHAALSALAISGPGGWQKYWDEWKAKGYIT